MKKGIILLFLLASPFMLTGCGDKDEDGGSKASKSVKTLTCKATVSGLDTTVNIEYNTKDKEVKSAKTSYVMDLSSYTDDQIEQIKKTDLCASFNGEMATDCKTTYEDKKLVVNVDMDIDYMVKTEFEGNKNMELDDIKAGYEKNLSAECTVK